MIPTWLASVAALLLRSRPFRQLLVAVAIATIVAATTNGVIKALKPSPEQEREASIGRAAAAVFPYEESSPAGTELAGPDWAERLPAEVELSTLWTAQAPISAAAGGYAETSYTETSLPSPALDGALDLVSGVWPTRPGECVATDAVATDPRPSIGHWPLREVGRIKRVYQPGYAELACAPGTWQTWTLTPAERESALVGAGPTWYLTGPDGRVAAALRVMEDHGALKNADVTAAASFLESSAQQVTAQRFLGQRLPLAIPGAFAVIGAAMLARWGAAVARALTRAGVPERPMLRTMATTTVVSAAVTAGLTALLGSGVAWVLRPVVLGLRDQIPLSPWRLDIDDAALLAALVAACAWLGFAASARLGRAKLRQADRPPRPLGRRARLVLAGAAAAIAATGVIVLLNTGGQMTPMIAGGVILSLAAALAAVPLVADVGSLFGSRPASGATLAGRALADDSRHFGGFAALTTATVAVVVTLFTLSSSSIAGQLLLVQSTVPPGSAMLAAKDPDGRATPPEVVARFESDLGVRDPVRLTDLNTIVSSGEGQVQVFDTIDDARAVLGDLGDAEQVLLRGGLLTIRGFKQPDTLQVEVPSASAVVSLPAHTLSPPPEHRYATGGAFALRPALPQVIRDAPAVSAWLVYRGLTPEQDAAARAWPATSGITAYPVYSYRPAEGFSLPTWISISLLGFGLCVAPTIASALGREARAMRPLAATLHAVGVPNRWIRATFTTLATTLLATSLTLATAAATLATALLHIQYPAAFYLPGVPWWMLAIYITALAAAGYLAVLASLRKLRHREPKVTI